MIGVVNSGANSVIYISEEPSSIQGREPVILTENLPRAFFCIYYRYLSGHLPYHATYTQQLIQPHTSVSHTHTQGVVVTLCSWDWQVPAD